MKIFHTICAAFMAATIASCDAHQDFPDTSMKIGDILCTDGKVVRYGKMKSTGKDTHSRGFLCQSKRGY